MFLPYEKMWDMPLGGTSTEKQIPHWFGNLVWIVVGAICNAVSFMAAHGFLNGVRHTGNTLGMLQKWGGANYTGEELYEERQAVRDGNVVTANGTGQLEFTRECLLALSADTPEAIEASYKFNKEGFCGR
jgi:hypothetical protein